MVSLDIKNLYTPISKLQALHTLKKKPTYNSNINHKGYNESIYSIKIIIIQNYFK